jgi:tetratricopeptide (TPR) repeat protein
MALSGPLLADEESEAVADHVLAAEEALKEHRYQDAAEEYRMAAELSDDAEIAKAATRIGYSYGFNDDALGAAERWAKLEPLSEEAILYLAQLYLRTGEIRKSREEFEKLLEKSDQPVDEQLIRLIPILAREDSTNAFELMRQLARPYRKSPFAHYAVAVLALDADELETAEERARDANAPVTPLSSIPSGSNRTWSWPARCCWLVTKKGRSTIPPGSSVTARTPILRPAWNWRSCWCRPGATTTR